MSFGKRRSGEFAAPRVQSQPAAEIEPEAVSTVGMIGFIARNLGPTSDAGLMLGSVAAGGIILAVLVHVFFGVSSACYFDERSLDPKRGVTANLEAIKAIAENQRNCSQIVVVNKRGDKFLRTRSASGSWTMKPYEPWKFEVVWRPAVESAKNFAYPFVRAVW